MAERIIKLFENFFEDMEKASELTRKPVYARKSNSVPNPNTEIKKDTLDKQVIEEPEEIKTHKKSKPSSNIPIKPKAKPGPDVKPKVDPKVEDTPKSEPKVEDKPKEEHVTEPDKESVKKSDQEPKQIKQPETESTSSEFRNWIDSLGIEIIELEETDKSNKAWINLKNGVSIRWEISLIDYPYVSASFKLGEDVVYLTDAIAGKYATQIYEETREYRPKSWASGIIRAGLKLPEYKRRWEKRAINRATDQDADFSKYIGSLFKIQNSIN